MDEATRRENEFFEDEVRRIARELWPAASNSGSMMIDGRERDGVFETEECIHLVEATTSRRKDRAQENVDKLVPLIGKIQKKSSTKAVRGWIVTRDEPTVDQRQVVEKQRPVITILSFAHFQSRLIDSRAYLSIRDNWAFGSVRDPATGDKRPRVDYIELMLSNTKTGVIDTPANVLAGLHEGHRFVILGDYGAGKSMTLRWVFQALRSAHNRGETSKFPVYINLRDHYGQDAPQQNIEPCVP